MDESPALRRYNYYSGPQRLDDVFTLKRGALTLRCALSTKSVGWELRLTAGSNLLRTEICKTETEVFQTAETWKTQAIAQGWS